MIIWYRTNTDFEGQLANIARQQTPAEAQAWLDAQEDDPGQGFIVLDERLIDPVLLADLGANPAGYTVEADILYKDGEPVDLGYTSDPAAALVELRGDAQARALLIMPEVDLRAWLDTQSTTDVFVMIRNVLGGMARALGVARE